MSNQIWSWLLSGLGLVVVYLGGKSNTRQFAWALGVFTEAVWLAYAIITRQYGFVAMAFVFAVFYARNFYLGRLAG